MIAELYVITILNYKDFAGDAMSPAFIMGSYSVEVAVQTVNLLPSGSGGSTPSLPFYFYTDIRR